MKDLLHPVPFKLDQISSGDAAIGLWTVQILDSDCVCAVCALEAKKRAFRASPLT